MFFSELILGPYEKEKAQKRCATSKSKAQNKGADLLKMQHALF